MLEYSVNGGATQQQSWAGSLAPFEVDVITLPTFTSQGGTNTVEVTVTTPNGVTDENALNNTTSTEFTSYEGPTYNFTLTLVLDDYGSETAWTLKRLGQTLYEGGPYQDGTNGDVVSTNFCLEQGCYLFRITDSYGDGMCCDYGEGSWTITDPNGLVVGSGGEFISSEQIQFCADETLGQGELDKRQLKAFPIPASSEVHVIWPEASGQACVLDAMGRQIQCELIQSIQTTWNTQKWAEGTYIVQWCGESGQTSTTRISVVR